MKEVRECFKLAKQDELKGKKHKGLLIGKVNEETAKSYLTKAKLNIQLCELYKKNGFDYMIPEAWYYTLYYCALAILLKFGITSRSQRCTAIFLRYAKEKGLIEYEDEFIDRITVYSSKEEKSDVDERENARYSSGMQSKEIEGKYDSMNNLCKKAISQAEEIVFSDKEFKVPKEIFS